MASADTTPQTQPTQSATPPPPPPQTTSLSTTITSTTAPQAIPGPQLNHPMQDDSTAPQSTPVEMSNLAGHGTGSEQAEQTPAQGTTAAETTTATATATASTTPAVVNETALEAPPTTSTTNTAAAPPPAPPVNDEIAPSPVQGAPAETENPLPATPAVATTTTGAPTTSTVAESEGPSLTVTILPTEGPRHAFNFTPKYLHEKRLNLEGNDALNMSVGMLKDLIWAQWLADWQDRPTGPNSIRLISFGKVLDDDSLLKEHLRSGSANIVHMAVRPQDIVDEEDAKGATHTTDNNNTQRSTGCRCVVM